MPVIVDPPIISAASVVREPSYDVMRAYYPRKAWDEGLQGMVDVDCLVDERGQASDCQVVEDGYPGLGFGEASIGFATQFRLKPRTENGRPVVSRASFWIFWTQRYDEHPMAFRAPGGTMMPNAYPPAALAAGRGGHVVLECLLASDRALQDCRIADEDDPRDGFADAALAFVPYFELRNCVAAGLPQPVRISFYWWPPQGPSHQVFTQIGYNKRFTSMITGEPVDRSQC